MLTILASLSAMLLLGACAYLQHPKFGTRPTGERQEKIERSQHYVDGAFQNQIDTPNIVGDESFFSLLMSHLTDRIEGIRPDRPIPTRKTNLMTLDRNKNVVIWLGHSSFFVQLEGKRLLIDPVLSSYAAPIALSTRAFDGTNLYSVGEMPDIDVLLITHDHWDHLDYATITGLESRVDRVFTPLGVGAHLEFWGYPRAKIEETDWFGSMDVGNGLTATLVPARHFSGRLFTRNKTLWGGFVLTAPGHRILFSGDTGYGPHFKEIARRLGHFDLVALDMGQYDPRWPYIHMTPEEAAQAAEDLRAEHLLPGHVGRFSIARHTWKDPFERIDAASNGRQYKLVTPMIGETLFLDQLPAQSSHWWKNIDSTASNIAEP